MATSPCDKRLPGGGARLGRPLSLLEAALALLIVPLAASAWLSLATAHLGVFSPAAVGVGGVALLCVALAATASLAPRAGRSAGGRISSGLRSAWRWLLRRKLLEWLTLALILAAAWRAHPAATPWPAYLDAAWYLNAGARIAADRALASEPLALPQEPEVRRAVVSTLADGRAAGLNFPAADSLGFFDVAWSVEDAREGPVTPYHPPLYSSWIALWIELFGIENAGNAVLPWSLAFLLAVGALATAAFGVTAAAVAVALLAIGPAFAYYGSTPFAETAAGALVVTGLLLVTRLAEIDDRAGDKVGHKVESSGPEPRVPEPHRRGPQLVLAAAAGLVLGLAILLKIDAALALIAALVWLAVARRGERGALQANRRLQLVLVLLAGATVGLGHAALLGQSESQLYYYLNGWGVATMLRSHAALIGAGGVALLVALSAGWVALRGGHISVPPGVVRTWVGYAVVAGPAIATVAGAMGPEAAPPDTLQILSWLVTPLVVWAAALGLLVALGDGDRRAGPLIVVALLVVPLVLIAPTVTRDLSPMYTARRFVPLLLPTIAALAGAAVQRLVDDRRKVRAGQSAPSSRLSDGLVAGTALATLLVVAVLARSAAPLRAARDFSGGDAITHRLAAYGHHGDVFLFPSSLGGEASGRMAGALWALEDRPTAVLSSPNVDAGAVSALLAEWEADGRRVYYVTSERELALSVSGYRAYEVGHEALITYVLAPDPRLPPRWSPLELEFFVYELARELP